MKKEFRLILNLTKYPKCGIIISAFANIHEGSIDKTGKRSREKTIL